VPTRISVVVATKNEPELDEWLRRVAAIVAPFDAEILIVDDSDAAPAGRA
jgi:hypothetical protein